MAERTVKTRAPKSAPFDKTDAALERVHTLTPADKVAVNKYGIVTAERLNVRNKTSKEHGSVIMVLDKGSRIMILDTLGDWYKVEAADKIGFCMKEFIREE